MLKKESINITAFNKPSQWTHDSAMAWFQQKTNAPRITITRLEKNQSGLFLTTQDESIAKETLDLIHQHQVVFCFEFATTQKPPADQWIDHDPSLHNARFEVVKKHSTISLIEVELTAPEKISLLLKKYKMDLLNETLFCRKIDCPQKKWSFSTNRPYTFDHLDVMNEKSTWQWLNSIERRKLLYPELFNGKQCLRVIHTENTPLRADLLGSVLQLGWWADSLQELPTNEQIHHLLQSTGAKDYNLTIHTRSSQEKQKLQTTLAEDSWVASENNIQYHFHRDQGISAGLFLDQRSQRRWVQQHSNQKKVLNLFCYTSGFSLNAAVGGALSVTSVDLSRKYIDWSQKNFELNQLDKNLNNYKFYDMDSFDFLKWALKKNETYDLIICDPPSFSRNKNNIFNIEKDFPNLIEMMAQCLTKDGIILFSTNYEKWSWKKWESELKTVTTPLRLKTTASYNTELDFELDPTHSIMKAFHITH